MIYNKRRINIKLQPEIIYWSRIIDSWIYWSYSLQYCLVNIFEFTQYLTHHIYIHNTYTCSTQLFFNLQHNRYYIIVVSVYPQTYFTLICIYILYIVFFLPPYISPLWKLEMTLQTAAVQVADDRSILVRPLVMAWPKKWWSLNVY